MAAQLTKALYGSHQSRYCPSCLLVFNAHLGSSYAGAPRGIWAVCRGRGALQWVLQCHAGRWYMGRAHGTAGNVPSNRLQYLYSSGKSKPCSLPFIRKNMVYSRKIVDSDFTANYYYDFCASCTLQLKTPRWHIRNFESVDTFTLHLWVFHVLQFCHLVLHWMGGCVYHIVMNCSFFILNPLILWVQVQL